MIDGLKFDLRLYVLVTSYEPLRIYVYEEGLARFACEKYELGQKENKHMHLTNYSINKHSEQYVANEHYLADDEGHKWSLSALCRFLESSGVNTEPLWGQIYDLVIKTVISCEPSILMTSKKLKANGRNSFELLGFDVLVDENLKPWLLEVNLSPSLATDSPLDMHIKSNLVKDVLTLVGLRAYDSSIDRAQSNCRASKYPRTQSPAVDKHRRVDRLRLREFVRDTLEEQTRQTRFVRIYPSLGSDSYDQFFESPRPVNSYVYNVLYVELMHDPLNASFREQSFLK